MTQYYFEITRAVFTIYVVLLLAAAIFDAWKFIIPNWLSLVLVLLFVATALVSPFGVDWLSHLAAAGIVLLCGFVLYCFKIFGAGDIKLMTAVALWAGLADLPEFLIDVALFGGFLALFLIVLRRAIFMLLAQPWWRGSTELPRVLVNGEAIPYGVGIAAGAIYVGNSLPLLGNV